MYIDPHALFMETTLDADITFERGVTIDNELRECIVRYMIHVCDKAKRQGMEDSAEYKSMSIWAKNSGLSDLINQWTSQYPRRPQLEQHY